ncbi:hypothetical protein PHLGIDRAFT_16052 [Phlebiopsis gigantea 11061_1 CR5-6]|uniref:G-alpha-domain-containing protein n=1 Tax=Phlebiopsis gigantea (strain 11061_1 CR5-6) TaxID=745531 RepID=A0A0C3S4T4_PHLG1|nr:hypothetical protein PHLGIDRAFT_16052 [Phlebiopsis gigantea 11061_1 CR5-6]
MARPRWWTAATLTYPTVTVHFDSHSPMRGESDDPLTRALAPPPGETPEARADRLRAEAAARRVSDQIDAALDTERAALKKARVMKMLLLGQSESDMQMAYTPRAWAQERAAWKAVIQLNLIRSVNAVVDALADALSSQPPPPPPSEDGQSPSAAEELVPPERRAALRTLRMRLSPLRQVEADLKARLGAGTREPAEAAAASDARDSATEVLAGCADDVGALWADGTVRAVVGRRRLLAALGDSAEYFLECADRIATRDYEPSDDDILRARIRTMGVQEYRLSFENTSDSRGLGREWVVFDVGGARTQRAAWLPFFADVHAVLFLAPISAFDERLAEDPRVNRLEDSFVLWQSICKSALLTQAVLILFMNKCDLLERKLARGVQVSRYMTSYGARPNDAASFSAYLRTKFKDVLALGSPEKRMFYGFTTSVVDAQATAATLASVRDGILHTHLKDAAYLD